MIISRAGLDLNQIWRKQLQLAESDVVTRNLERQASQGSTQSGIRLARARFRSGTSVSDVHDEIGDNHDVRKHVVNELHKTGRHDDADHLHLTPLAHNYQRAQSAYATTMITDQYKTEEGKRAAATHKASKLQLISAADEALRQRGIKDHTPDESRAHAAKYFSKTHTRSQLVNHLIAWHGGIRHGYHHSGSDREVVFHDAEHNGGSDHWNNTRVDSFKKSLDHHDLGKITSHQVEPEYSLVNDGEVGDHHHHYTIGADHTLAISHSSKNEEHSKPNAWTQFGELQYDSPRDYVSRYTRLSSRH